MQVFSEPEQQLQEMELRDGVELAHVDNTYATIQHNTRRESGHVDDMPDYATLAGGQRAGSSNHSSMRGVPNVSERKSHSTQY